MKLKDLNIEGKLVLAPLAGYTNMVYRKIVKSFGASLVYSEMISSKGLLFDNDKTWIYTQIDEAEHPVALQLFGSNALEMHQAAKELSQRTKVDIIDINMGCPVYKVLKQASGVALLKDVNKVYEITKAVVEASPVPVSVKIRAGLSHDSINCVEVSKAIEAAGASLITIHGRTKSDLYKGSVNLDYIKMVKDAVSIPVIGNGDIKNAKDALDMFDYTGVDAVMIGRASLGNPWIFKEIKYALENKEYTPPSAKERLDMLIYHLDELIKLKGERVAILEMRSLASCYVKGMNNLKQFRQALMRITKYEDFISLFNEEFKEYFKI